MLFLQMPLMTIQQVVSMSNHPPSEKPTHLDYIFKTMVKAHLFHTTYGIVTSTTFIYLFPLKFKLRLCTNIFI